MNKRRIQEFLIHPAFLSLIIWFGIILLIHIDFPKYKIKHIGDEYPAGKITYYYDELDSDGKSERISIDLNDMEQTKIILRKTNKVLSVPLAIPTSIP